MQEQIAPATAQSEPAAGVESTPSLALIQDVERLRVAFPRTADLYKEVCALLFFRYDETPTATRLFQLVRKGSNSAPKLALEEFWKTLRGQSRARVANPDIPPALQDAAGEMVQALWQAAQGVAKESLAGYVQQAQAEVLRAQDAERAANEERMRVIELLDRATQKGQESAERIQSLEGLLQSAQERVAVLEADARVQAEEIVRHHAALARVQAEATEERQRLIVAAETSEARFRDSEKRMLVEIDRERMNSNALGRQLEDANKATVAANERRQTETLALHREIGDLRQTAGKLEGSLQVMTSARDTALEKVGQLQASLFEAEGRLALMGGQITEKERLVGETAAALESASEEITQLNKKAEQLAGQVAALTAAGEGKSKV
jgi:chromosome segregation ATPase